MSNPYRSLVFFPGCGLGDMICSLPVLDWMLERFPDYEIDACNTISPDIYRAIIGPRRAARLRNIFKDKDSSVLYYTWIECHEFTRMLISPEHLGSRPDLFELFELHGKRRGYLNHMDEVFPAGGNQMARVAAAKGLDRVTLPQWCVGIDKFTYPKIEAQVPSGDLFDLLPEKYITINDGWTSTGKGLGRATKAWQPDAWADFVRRAKDLGLKIVQIGSTDTGQSYDVDVQLRGKTSFHEALSILSCSTCHIDIEGGLVHAAAALGTRSVVMHGPTNAQFFSYRQNINLKASGCTLSDCWHLTPNWTHTCLTGAQSCMKHKPKDVIRAVKEIIGR